jgi:antirestriction protein ArdC
MTFRQAVELDAHVRKGERGSTAANADLALRCADTQARQQFELVQLLDFAQLQFHWRRPSISRPVHFVKGHKGFQMQKAHGQGAAASCVGSSRRASVIAPDFGGE